MSVWRRLAGLGLLVFAGAVAVAAAADERILSYRSDITVHPDGGVDVVETITVRAEENRIRRGIYRDFPTDYEDRLGNRVQVGFDVRQVRRDGNPEAFHIERRANGVRVYAGSANVFLPSATYEYEISYHTTRMLGFFAKHDELYWNVTGNGWEFPIDQVAATVRVPASVESGSISVNAYTGSFGSTEQAYRAHVDADGTVRIDATRGLGTQEGLTVVVTWPKGHVAEPSTAANVLFLLRQNRGLLIALTGALSAIIYLFLAWRRVGMDPPPGVIFPHYEPPDGFSPASLRFVSKMGYDKRTLTAAVLSLAVKGFIKIDKVGDVYALQRTDKANDSEMAAGEGVLLSRLFSGGRHLLMDDDNHAVIGGAMKAHKRTLRRYHQQRYFVVNGTFLLPAIGLMAVAVVVILKLDDLSLAVGIALAAGIAAIPVFAWLLKAPTMLGRKLLDRVEGFRMYLEVAEKDELDLKNPPQQTPELFEAYLPYALALGVEQPWAEQFVRVFAKIDREQGRRYRPNWYSGHWDSSNPVKLANTVGSSLSSAISSASTPPGSSSGGGFSGGGGGGGGGGGW